MKRRLLCLFVISPLVASISPVAPQTPQSTQTAPTQLSSPKWTETDRKAWLFKARRGDGEGTILARFCLRTGLVRKNQSSGSTEVVQKSSRSGRP